MEHTKSRAEGLFSLVASGRLEAFLEVCHEDLMVTLYGSEPAPTVLARKEIGVRWESLRSQVADPAHSTIEAARSTENAEIVILRQSLGGDHLVLLQESVHFLAFHEGLLTAWTSYPMDLSSYASMRGRLESPKLAAV